MLRLIHIKTITAFIIVLFLVLPCYGEQKERSIEQRQYPEFSGIESFGIILVYLDFDPRHQKKLGLKREELNDFLILKYKNNLADFPYKKASWSDRLTFPEDIGVIYLKIITEGVEYPIAYWVELNVGNDANWNVYEHGKLGYCDKNSIVNEIKGAITGLMERFAIAFFKARGEM